MSGLSSTEIWALFHPEDLQDVECACELLREIWSLPELDIEHFSPTHVQNRQVIHILGKLFQYLLYPYICIKFCLSEQLEYLSAAAHLCLVLYSTHGKSFMPTLLYVDLMIMIKNVYFCVAKAKVDDPDGKFWIILLGTDRLEQLFGILKTMVGNDANLDIHQLVIRLAGTTETFNILAAKPEWDKSPCRLRLPTINRNGINLTVGCDHINPASWRGDVSLSNVTLVTCWNNGHTMIEEMDQRYKETLDLLEFNPHVTILAPYGTLLIDQPLDADDTEEAGDGEDSSTNRLPSKPPLASSEQELPISVEVEDGVTIEDDSNTPFSKFIEIDGKQVNKSRALAGYQKYRHHATSTDRLRCVKADSRYDSNTSG